MTGFVGWSGERRRRKKQSESHFEHMLAEIYGAVLTSRNDSVLVRRRVGEGECHRGLSPSLQDAVRPVAVLGSVLGLGRENDFGLAHFGCGIIDT